MTAGRRPRLSAIVVLLILGLVAFILYFVFFINPNAVLFILSKTNIVIYSFAFVAYFTCQLFSALGWRNLLHKLSVKISSSKALLLTWVGLFFEATVPQAGFSGEISKAYFLVKDSKQDPGKVGASVIVQKIFNISITAVTMALGLALVLASYSLPLIATLTIAVVLAFTILSVVIIYWVSLKPTATRRLLGWAIRVGTFFRKRWNSKKFQERAEALLGRFHDGMAELKDNPKALIKPACYSLVSFIFEISVIFLTFIALGYPVPVDKVLIVFTLTGTVQTVGFTFFGFPDLIMTISFTALGIPPALSISVTLLTRVVSLWFRLMVSYMALQWESLKIIRQEQSNSTTSLPKEPQHTGVGSAAL